MAVTVTVKRLRLRLHRAAGWLANSALPVEQIARQSGYPNLQSFTRLFKGEYGLPPARYRAAGHSTAFTGPTRIAPGAARAVEIRALPAVDVVAIERIGPYMQIGQAFDTRFGRLAAPGLVRPGVRMLARFFDDPTAVCRKRPCARRPAWPAAVRARWPHRCCAPPCPRRGAPCWFTPGRMHRWAPSTAG